MAPNLEAIKEAGEVLYNKIPDDELFWLLGLRDAKDLKGLLGRSSQRQGVYPKHWVTPIHLSIGMAIRNKLRELGFTEEVLQVQNLDDVYEDILNVTLDIVIKEAELEV